MLLGVATGSKFDFLSGLASERFCIERASKDTASICSSVHSASWTSFHHGGGVGIGYSQHAGMVIVADGTEELDKRLSLVLNADPGMGIIRHVDAGYKEAEDCISKTNILFPSRD